MSRASSFLLASLGLLVACAKIGPPPGGPVDRTPPRVVAHTPPADATSVPLGASVELQFSEAMDRERVAEALFVTPETPLRLHWQGRRLRLDLSLQTDRTYVITIGTGARDLRGNPLEQSFTFAFATGPRLNQGQIRGRVYRDHRPAAGAHVWAYDLEGFRGEVGREAPAYRTQSGQDGIYAFARLATGQYRVLAFLDENRNQQWDAGEWLALPAADLTVDEADTAWAGDLALVPHLRPPPRLQRVQAVDDRRLLLEFSAPVSPARLEIAIEGLEVEQVYASPQDSARIYLRTALQEAGRPYPFATLKLDGQPLKWQEPVRGSGRAERTPPELVGRFPQEEQIAPGDALRLVFSEAMDLSLTGDLWLASDSTQVLEGSWHWEGPTCLTFVPIQSLIPGRYRLQILGERLRDLSGLPLRESLITMAFEVIAPEKMGRIQGRVTGGSGSPVWVIARSQMREYRALAAPDGQFVLEDMLPGQYAVYAFVDRDGDGRPGPGRLSPFAWAEPYGRFPRTLELKAGDRIELEVECK